MTVPSRLFEPVTVGRLRLKNRIAMLPHGTGMTRDGGCTDDDIAYFEARARAGVGLVITGGTIVDKSSVRRMRTGIEAYDERVLPSLQRRSDAIHAHGAKLVGQLFHFGRETTGFEMEYAPAAPSSVRSSRDPSPPHELEIDEIRQLVDAFGQSAKNLQSAGYDGVEIHGAHGYLVAQFLSPATNQRNDAYGGDAERRLRFVIEVIERIRDRCGSQFALGLRLSADEEVAGGLRIDDTVAIARAIAATTAVDYLSITIGIRGGYVKDLTFPLAPAAEAAKAIRAASGMPIILGQRILTPDAAEQLVSDGCADVVGMARALIADPDWVTKAARGDGKRIRPCIGVLQDCRSHAPHLHCAINPVAGRERRPEFLSLRVAEPAKKVAVIGGGPGGMEAARVAAERSHHVTLFEASGELGGQFRYAAAVPHRSGLRAFLDHVDAELRRLPVEINVNTRVETPSDLQGRFDSVIFATGAVGRAMDERLRRNNTATCFDIATAGPPPVTGHGCAVLVDDGTGFWLTYGVAEALAEAGWRILVTCPGPSIAAGIPQESVGPMLKRLGQAGAEYRVMTVLDDVADGGAVLADTMSGSRQRYECDLVVLQTGRVSVRARAAAFREAGLDVHSIGDCVSPRRVSHAVYEAQRVTRAL